MFTHPDTVVAMCEMRHQELLRLAAHDRIAASAQLSKFSLLALTKRVSATALSRLGKARMRRRGAPRLEVSVLSD